MTDTHIPVARDRNVAWVKSSYSDAGLNCVEVAHLTHAFAIRDSKVPGGPALLLPTAAFRSFLDGVREGHLDS
ncbi:DUF397 domain-containing protein [Streptomyces sp. PR69]|uniref:DUF397 domain-containing protein n=1 Tax=Streptomyces sp. PR69 TaxID=2984950 RepID=UPI002263FD3A|nr:DUF397 domain-containing protein [Streptomyces sp. PR69]